MEIVSRPDLRSAEEAAEFLRKLRSILRYLGTCDGNMEEGSMRADVNVSVRRPGASLGTRCEIKNINSMRFIVQAVEYEARRQIEILEGGGSIKQETRLFDSRTGETRSMRSKEEAHDYRYFPDPDLLPLVIDQSLVDDIARALPELPDQKKARYVALGQPAYDSSVLVAEKETADYFDGMLKAGAEPKAAANWLINEYFGRLNRAGLTVATGPVSAKANAEIVMMIVDNQISSKIAKDVLDIEWKESTGAPRSRIVDARSMKQVTDESAIEAAVDEVIAANPDKAAEARAKPKMASWFVGQVMKATQGKANPQSVTAILKRRLGLPDEG
jgi:aspartyl-tRNA(Asn)/glutamyl-tRNA(Gln) amidotransferase subunit B